MTTDVLILNGPNLNRLGTREPHIYGSTTYAELVTLCELAAKELGLNADVRQTNAEHELLAWLHEAADNETPVVLNAAALTHTSVSVGDACAMLTAPLVEVHISNVHKREAFRHHSYVSAHADAVIVGAGVNGYRLALRHLASLGE
ncbi:type II 3-dehydroquinate dehydratase [Phytomonospora endophytica]|uniref:3-dehydroquinate dehydratase n=1 Tax=Phytomonospora endophytica TaxID=714109 RepID=A0A841FXM7_9ACTN|nr:type II 3-dehydroquinate dehydratase [Phytomonospora endophytica]MBB6039483.1 3-dehydroquinate dehydratase-2 [Phytomonospora endophytica]GIG70210.1 3-dehydroquinate dehydratase [Phytomonospora endophytica]